MKIKVAVVEKKGDPFVIKDDIDLHEVGPTEVQVHMVASRICHSDEAIRKGDASLGYPVILGHEGAGIVEKVGSEVQNLKPGDHVVMAFTPTVCVTSVLKEFQLNVGIMLIIICLVLGLTVKINSKKMVNIFPLCLTNHLLLLQRLPISVIVSKLMKMLTCVK